MGKIKGWKKSHESNNALGKSERWEHSNGIDKIYLYGSIGQYGSREYTLKIVTISRDENYSSSDREALKKDAINYMRSNPNG